MNLDDRLNSAVRELRENLDDGAVPAFEPSRQVSLASAALAVVAALVIGAGLYSLVARQSNSTGVDSVLVTAPPPDGSVEQSGTVDGDTPPEAEADVADSAPAPSATDDSPLVTGEPTEYLTPTRLTSAGAGEFIAPSPGVSAWNSNDSLVLLYRTGDVPARHIVVDPESGQIAAELEIDAIDIEQVYWHPLDTNAIVWLEDNRLMSRNVYDQQDQVAITWDQCDVVTTGRFAGPPSASGQIAVLCHLLDAADGDIGTTSLLVADLSTGTSIEVALPDDPAAVASLLLSPSAELLAQGLGTGVIVITDLASGDMAELDLSDPGFSWVVLPDGSEALALASYDADTPGTIVLARPDFPGPIALDVLIGPDAGDEYPPPGTQISATVGSNSSRIVATVRGPAVGDSPLTGQVAIVTIEAIAAEIGSAPTTSRTLFGHEGAVINDYWSGNTVSVNAAGTRVIWASDTGTDRTDTFILDLAGNE